MFDDIHKKAVGNPFLYIQPLAAKTGNLSRGYNKIEHSIKKSSLLRPHP